MDKQICEKKCHKKDECQKKCHKKDECEKKEMFMVGYQPLTLIQNISQNIDSNGQLMDFQKSGKSKFAKLLPDLHSIKIRKNGIYNLSITGTINWLVNSNVTLSFALLKNGTPINESIQNQTILAGINKFNETANQDFTFVKGDILTFEIESSVSATTFVPSIVSGSNTFYGDGLTLTIQSLQTTSTNVSNTLQQGQIIGSRYIPYLQSINGLYKLLIITTRDDIQAYYPGDLIVIDNTGDLKWKVFISNANLNSGNTAILQMDGNFVYRDQRDYALWATGTNSNVPVNYRLVMSNDSKVRIYDNFNNLIWINIP